MAFLFNGVFMDCGGPIGKITARLQCRVWLWERAGVLSILALRFVF